jgi:hypothetical protein
MGKKPTKPQRGSQDESQTALSVVEKAIGGKLVDKVPASLPSALYPKSGKAVAQKPSKPSKP